VIDLTGDSPVALPVKRKLTFEPPVCTCWPGESCDICVSSEGDSGYDNELEESDGDEHIAAELSFFEEQRAKALKKREEQRRNYDLGIEEEKAIDFAKRLSMIPSTQLVASPLPSSEDEEKVEYEGEMEFRAALAKEELPRIEYCPNCNQNMETHYAQCQPPDELDIHVRFGFFMTDLMREHTSHMDHVLINRLTTVLQAHINDRQKRAGDQLESERKRRK
jgi:hypothetical protein